MGSFFQLDHSLLGGEAGVAGENGWGPWVVGRCKEVGRNQEPKNPRLGWRKQDLVAVKDSWFPVDFPQSIEGRSWSRYLKDRGQRLHAASRCVSSMFVAVIFEPWRSAKWDVNLKIFGMAPVSGWSYHYISYPKLSHFGWVFSWELSWLSRDDPLRTLAAQCRQRKEANRCLASSCFALNKWMRSNYIGYLYVTINKIDWNCVYNIIYNTCIWYAWIGGSVGR